MSNRTIAAAAAAVASLLISGCVSTETVTFTDAAIADATATALTAGVAAPPAGADGEPTTSPDNPPEPTTDAGDPQPTTSAGEPTTPPSTGVDVSDGACRFDSIDDFDDVQIELEFVSSLTSQSDATVNYAVLDGNGDLIIESGTVVEALEPGEPVRIPVDTVEDAPSDPAARAGITCEFRGIEAFDFGIDATEPSPDDACEFVELDFVGDIQLEIDVANPFSGSAGLVVTVALRSGDGIRFGTTTGFTETVQPGDRTTADIDSLTDVPEWLDLDRFRCEILAIDQF